jgi:hypothetical protein
MQESNPDYQLLDDLSSVVLVKGLLIFDKFKKVFSIHQLSNDVDVRLRLDALLELEQERMGYDLHDAALVANSIYRYAMRDFA